MIETPCGIVNITDRKIIELTGIVSIDSFDEGMIVLTVSCGTLTIEGEQLNITVLDLDKGKVCATGKINSVFYSDVLQSTGKGFMSALFGNKR